MGLHRREQPAEGSRPLPSPHAGAASNQSPEALVSPSDGRGLAPAVGELDGDPTRAAELVLRDAMHHASFMRRTGSLLSNSSREGEAGIVCTWVARSGLENL